MATETVTAEQFDKWLEQYGKRLEDTDYGPAFKRIKVLLGASTKENFAGSRSPDGITWLPLKRARTRNRKGGDKGTPLRDTGLLMASVTASGGAGHLETETRTRLEWGTNLDYARFHQDGTRFIPARPFLGFNEPLIEDIGNILGEFAAEELTR